MPTVYLVYISGWDFDEVIAGAYPQELKHLALQQFEDLKEDPSVTSVKVTMWAGKVYQGEYRRHSKSEECAI